MPALSDAFLPIIQDLNAYGGHINAFLVSRGVLNAIDAGARTDASPETIRDKLCRKLAGLKGLQDHKTLEQFFEAYYEGVFCLVAARRGMPLQAVAADSKKGKTADFLTISTPSIGFEVKTIDVADPDRTYEATMLEGLDAAAEMEGLLGKTPGAVFAEREIAPHGDAADRRDAVERVMRKIDGNVKAGQYEAAPTFLVVSLARTALHDGAEELRKRVAWRGQTSEASGQLFALAAHALGETFRFFPEHSGIEIVELGPLPRAGVLRDHTFIAGIVFLATEWSRLDDVDVIGAAYRLHGIWNVEWERIEAFGPEMTKAAKAAFEALCHHWNDTEDARASSIPER